MRKTTSEKIAIAFAVGFTVLAYARLFFATGTLDESQHLGSAFLTALGGRPFFNELFFQQGSSLLYEPLAWVYYQAFGTTGAQLAFRHLFFLMFAAWGWVTFRYFQKRVGFVTAVCIGLIPVVGANVPYPSLHYVSEGMAFFGMGAIFLLRALEERESRFTVYAGLSLFVSIAAYPTYVMVWLVFAICAAIGCRQNGLPFWRTSSSAAALGGFLAAAFYALCVWRFGWEEFLYSFEFSRAFMTFGDIGQKAAYTWGLFRAFAPPAWQWAPIVIAWWALNRWCRVPWVALAPALLFVTALQEPPELGAFTCTLLILYVLTSALILRGASLRRHWPELSLWVTGLICAPFFAWSSSMTLYAMHLSLVYAMFAVLALSDIQRPSRGWALAGLCVPGLMLYFYLAFYVTDDDPILEQTKFIESGYFAGLHTSPANYDFLRQLQEDIDLCEQKGRSALFYDGFPAGYLMTKMRPATRSLYMHGLYMSWKIRHIYTMYYTDPSVRPDCVFRFTKVRTTNGGWMDNDPKKYPMKDVFWDYLPGETDDYALLRIRDNYSVWQKKGI